MYFDREDIVRKVPKKIVNRTKENMEEYGMDLGDAFEEAVKTFAKKGKELWKAWYYSDFRKYIPSVYDPKFMDFEKYPLRYQV